MQIFIAKEQLGDYFNYGNLEFSKQMIYSLTAMSKLPKALQAKYGVDNWTDLTDEQLNNELDYVGSVSTLGWDSNGDKVTVLENKGGNIAPNILPLSSKYLTEIIKNSDNAIKAVFVGTGGYGYFDLTFHLSNNKYVIKWDESPQNQTFYGERSINGEKFFGLPNPLSLDFSTSGKKDNVVVLRIFSSLDGQTGDIREIYNFMISDNTDSKFIPPRQDKLSINTYAFNQFGISDQLFSENGELKKLKLWEKEEVTKSTTFTNTLKNGKGTCVLIKNDDGQVFENAISGTNITEGSEPDGTYTVFYQLATPEVEEIQTENSLSTLNSTDNQFVYSSYSEYKFIANGLNNTYSLPTKDTNYQVYVSGELVTEGITKNSSNVTFLLPPDNGKVIKVVYNKSSSDNIYMYSKLLQPVGNPESFEYFRNLSVTEVVEENRRNTKRGFVENTVKNKHYELDLTVDMFEDVEQFVEKWQGKKFQLIVDHGDKQEIYAPCEIIDNVVYDYWNSEAITIKILAQSMYWA
ncbi:hypothetical protein [Oceanotoga phage vB_OteS-UFV02]